MTPHQPEAVAEWVPVRAGDAGRVRIAGAGDAANRIELAGRGAAREVCEFIMRAQNSLDRAIEGYLL